ncbi:MAG: hypothetical protein K2K57_02555 [Oscillospiraceae bacterium]|nr:hypothetical protein [Oscillospiraceae bacterium]
MKKFTAVLAAAVIMAFFGGCSGNNNEASSAENDTDVLTELLEMTEETDSYNIGEASEENSENDNLKKDTDKGSVIAEISEEERALLEDIREGGYLVMQRDGSFLAAVGEEASDYYVLSYKGITLSDEYYEMMSEYAEYSSKEEYAAEIFEMYPQLEKYYDKNGNLKKTNEEKIIIDIRDVTYNYNESETDHSKEAFSRVGEWVMSRLKGDEELREGCFSAAEKSGFAWVFALYEWDENGIIEARLKSSSSEGETEINDMFHVSGKEGVMLGNSFVFADTKKLALTSREKWEFAMLAGDFVPEDCELICDDDKYYSGELWIDLAEVAEKLPELTELYMYQANVTSIEGLRDMENLETLSYYAVGDSSTPFTELKNLKTLRLYGDYEDYSFLNEMDWLEEIHVTYDGDDRNTLDSLFECRGLTSLEIDAWGGDLKLDINGIDKLEKLKKLDITGSDIDFAPISRLPELEDLKVRCVNGEKNVKELKNAPKLKKLFLSDLDIMSWNFLEDMPVLEDLYLFYTPYVTNADIKPLKNLKSLSLCEAGCDSEAVEGLENLERFSYSIYSGWQDYSKLSTCKSLRELAIMGSGGVLNCEDIKNAPLEIIYCDGTDVENAEALAEIKTLKSIYIAMGNGKLDCGDMLKEALPDCDVNMEGDAFFHTAN